MAPVIPSPWVAVVLALAAFRVTRLIGWDDLPPIVAARRWALGESTQSRSRPGGDNDVYVYVYKRPLLAHFVHCPFCIGFWVALAVYLLWLFEPTGTLYGSAPFALSAFVGLLAKNLDP